MRKGLPAEARLWLKSYSTRGRLASFQLAGRSADGITALEPIRERFPDFAELLEPDQDEAMVERLRKAETIGRPLGNDAFIDRIAAATGRSARPGKRGPKPRGGEA